MDRDFHEDVQRGEQAEKRRSAYCDVDVVLEVRDEKHAGSKRTMYEEKMILAERGATAAESARHLVLEVREEWRPIRTSVLPCRTWNPALWGEAPPHVSGVHMFIR